MTEFRIRRGPAMALMMLGTVLISFGGLLIRSIEAADVWQIAFYRSLALFCVIALLLSLRYRGATPRQVRAVGRQGIFAGLCMAGATLCFLHSITSTTVANTLFMLSAVPFITAFLAWLVLGETLRASTLVTMIAAAVGVSVMLAGGVGAGSTFGNAMGLATALFFSGYALLVRRNRALDMLPLLLVSSAVVMAIAGAVTWHDMAISGRDLVLCFVIGGILSGGANTLFIGCARHLAAAELTLFTLLEIALGPFWVWLVLHETPRLATLLGGMIVIGAVLVRAFLDLARARRRAGI